MDASFQRAIEAASAAFAGGRSIRMPTGAGHDAQVLATMMPAGMLFVPSIAGISHHWTENTADADIVTGAEVFVDACRRLLAGEQAFRRPALSHGITDGHRGEYVHFPDISELLI